MFSLASTAAALTLMTPTPAGHLPNVQRTEGDSGRAPLVVNVALDRPNPYPYPVSVLLGDFTTRPVPGSNQPRTYGTATPGQDYEPITQFRLEWAPGQQIARFPITLLGDESDEADENINVRISGPSGGQIRDNDIDVVIRDNDPLGTTNPWAAPGVRLPNATLTEPDAGCAPHEVSLHLARPNVSGRPVSVQVVDYTTRPVPGSNPPRIYGGATPGVDYTTFAPFRLSFAPGATA